MYFECRTNRIFWWIGYKREIDDYKDFSLNSWKNGFVLEIKSLLVGQVLWERGRVQFEMSIRYPGGNVE